MGFVRATAFNVLFYGLTAVLSVLYLPLLVLPRHQFMFFTRSWAGMSLWLADRICGIKVRVIGGQNLPETPSLYASKHQSAFETLALTVLVERPVFVLKKELLSIPLFGLYLRKVGSVAIDRKAGASAIKHMVQDAKQRIAEGRNVIIFAEGTRTSPDDENPTYHPGVAALYSQLGVPCVPVALNSGLCWGRKAIMKQAGIITVAFLPPIAAGVERKAFLAQVREQVESTSRDLRDEERARKQELFH